MSAPEPLPCPGCDGERTQVFLVDGMDCAAEVGLVEGRLRRLTGVCSVRASAMTGRATVVHTLTDGAVERALAEVGLRAREAHARGPSAVPAGPTLAAFALTLVGFLVAWLRPGLETASFLAAIVVGGAGIARKGVARARQGALDMNVLMTVAVLGAMAIAEWAEGATTVVLFSLAQLLEARSLERARRAIAGLMDLAPEQALVKRGGAEQRVAAATVAVGETIVVAPGERLPLDGIVKQGRSEVDQSSLTGESTPLVKEPGSEVFAGSVNGSGALMLAVTRPASETTLARIIHRVEEAQASRAPSQGFVDRFARVYTPLVVGLAAVLAVGPPLVGLGAFADWFYRALVLLVIACPCALVISTPVSVVSALTAASRRGVLVKGGAHLEAMGRVRAVVFDKTGTLTRGRLVVTDVLGAAGRQERDVLRLAAAIEARARHPLGAAVLERARGEGIAPEPAADVTLLPGRGVRGRVDGLELLVGSHRLFDERGLCDHALDVGLLRLESEGKTVMLVGGDGHLAGAVAVADELRPEAAEAIVELRREGVDVWMLTGDNSRTAEAVARRLGLEEWAAELLPEDKVTRVRELQARHGETAMVGDGVNDAPALAAATVGIAMAGSGTDVAIETADVALLSDDLRRIPETLRLGRAARRVIRTNIALALVVKAAVLGLALLGYGSLWAAVAADMGASLLVIGNGLRLLNHARGR